MQVDGRQDFPSALYTDDNRSLKNFPGIIIAVSVDDLATE
jgi:hypothetical protein